jgi:probable rRNA maturation factor
MPTIHFFNHQSRHRAPLDLWQSAADRALPLCLAAAKSPDCELSRLEEIEVSLVSDEEISRVHGEFLADPTPTDVITFPHGEIFISLDTAERQAKENNEPYEREVELYLIHALLHLAGWDDREETSREAMRRKQAAILDSVWRK